PVGIVSVGFPVQHYDVITYLSWSARVLEEKTTEVNVFDPRDDRRLTARIQVGDGSKKQFASGTSLGAEREVDNVNVESSLLTAFRRRSGAPQKKKFLKPKLILDLTSHSDEQSSFEDPDWTPVDEQGRIALQGVTPGRYHLKLAAFPGRQDLG